MKAGEDDEVISEQMRTAKQQTRQKFLEETGQSATEDEADATVPPLVLPDGDDEPTTARDGKTPRGKISSTQE